jgi:hypothetical protein
MPLPVEPNRTSARIRAPWVTSGSSPASFTMPAMAISGFSSARANGKLGRSPFGSAISTGSGNRPVSRAANAALVAAVAQAPVVQPRRSDPAGLRLMARL